MSHNRHIAFNPIKLTDFVSILIGPATEHICRFIHTFIDIDTVQARLKSGTPNCFDFQIIKLNVRIVIYDTLNGDRRQKRPIFAFCKRCRRDTDAQHQHRQQPRQQTAKLFRFLHIITPFSQSISSARSASPHVLSAIRLKPSIIASGLYAPDGHLAGSSGSGLTVTLSASVLSPSRSGRAITTRRASSIS